MTLIGISGLTATPAVPWFRMVPGDERVLFIVEGSGIYSLDEATSYDFARDPDTLSFLRGTPPTAAPIEPEPTALSLNIAQSCNLTCSYCYADEGRFGAQARLMPLDVAIDAVRQLLSQRPARGVSVGFIGGEPLLNRSVMHATVAYAAREAALLMIPLTFGITTNATLLEPRDLELFRAHPFAVTVSLDGPREVHDAVRRTKRGQGSFNRAVERIRPLLRSPGLAKVAARCTITRQSLEVDDCVEALCEAGFAEVGVSPLRTGPDPDLVLRDGDWQLLLEAMKRAATKDWERARKGAGLRFSNLAVALKQLHRGAANTLPCNSAASYVSVSVEGDYYTCHRTVGDPRFRLGGPQTGPSPQLRRSFVESRQVDSQEPCRSCWARYLCGGGCHAEVMQAGRSGCDYIRGWLEHCIALYPRVLAERPDLLS